MNFHLNALLTVNIYYHSSARETLGHTVLYIKLSIKTPLYVVLFLCNIYLYFLDKHMRTT